MRFSQRKGYKPAQKIIQRTNIDNELRNGLWNLLTVMFWDKYKYVPGSLYKHVSGSNMESFIRLLWIKYFKEPIDEIPRNWNNCLEFIREYFFNADWYEVYDFIEFIAQIANELNLKNFTKYCNVQLEKENSAYRFVEKKIIEITSKDEIESIEESISKSEKYHGVKKHLESSLYLMSDRKNPDFRNSIKESISAIESLCNHIVGKKNSTLGEALKEIEKSKKMHPALNKAFSSLYGYTSDKDGIRHALMEESDLKKSDAKFMLVACSAFVNYLIEIYIK